MRSCHPDVDTEISTLWYNFARLQLVEQRNKLIEHYLPKIDAAVRRFVFGKPKGICGDSLYSAASLALIAIVESFDPHRGVKFWSFAYSRIVGAMLDELRRQDIYPRAVRQLERKRKLAEVELSHRNNRPPTDNDLMLHLGWTRETLRKSRPKNSLSLETVTLESDYRSYSIEDCLIAEFSFPDIDARDALADLDIDDAVVAHLYYWRKATFAEIAQVMKVSPSMIWQIHRRILECLLRRA